jgi:hypothetical protein
MTTTRNRILTASFAIFTMVTSAAHAGSAPVSSCSGGILTLRPGADIDWGWSGAAHNVDLTLGPTFSYRIVSRCSDSDAVCSTADDCASKQCNATCDCETDTSCEIAGPIDPKRCLDGLDECTTNADCPGSGECASLAGPPLPLTIEITGETPLCFLVQLDAPVSGTIDTASGEVSLSTSLRWRGYLGDSLESPCPRCGAPDEAAQVGETFTCEGGPNDGSSCTVHASANVFGGSSYDCPVAPDGAITGSGILTPLPEITTGETSLTAAFPCRFFGFTGNPLQPGTNPKCIDKNGVSDPVCASNADCKRCTGSVSTACSSNADCTGAGVCAESPEQPITCGFWCHCGFCDANASLPCFDTSQCPENQECVQGTLGAGANQGQQRPNDCEGDAFICGTEEPETCDDAARQCFGPVIERAGEPSPLGSYCTFTGDVCLSNADCNGDGDVCATDVLAPGLEGLFCSQAAASGPFNSAVGITGPGALDWNALIRVCRCADPSPECESFCTLLGPAALCGDANQNGEIQTSDALRALQSSVGQPVVCPLHLCDVNNNGQVQTSDALGILRKSVGQSVTLECPPQV